MISVNYQAQQVSSSKADSMRIEPNACSPSYSTSLYCPMMSTMLTPPPSASLSSWTRKSDKTSPNSSPQTPGSTTFEKMVEKKLLPPGTVYYSSGNNSVGKYHSFNEQYCIPVEDKTVPPQTFNPHYILQQTSQLPIQYAPAVYRQPVIHIIPNSNLGYFANTDNTVMIILSSPPTPLPPQWLTWFYIIFL